jgi:glycosyltransferase involved in cell wall biosynthesis
VVQEDKPVQVSVIIPVGERHSDATELYADYARGLSRLGKSYEMIFVLDGARPRFMDGLERLIRDGQRLTIIKLSRSFGESTALMAGFERASGEIIVTLPAYHQIEGADIGKLVDALDSADVATGHRWPRVGGRLEALRRAAFHGLTAWVTGQHYRDLGCRARALRRRVLSEISLYGDQHFFLAVLADRQGFRVREVDVRQSPKDRFLGRYRGREYAHRVLDIFTVFFLVRFTKKPLRFFGMIGVSTFGIGALLLSYLVVDRLVLHHPLADRPALLLSSLLVVLGLQLFALGLLGELIIFTHARGIKDYQVDEVIQYPQRETGKPAPRVAQIELISTGTEPESGNAPGLLPG